VSLLFRFTWVTLLAAILLFRIANFVRGEPVHDEEEIWRGLALWGIALVIAAIDARRVMRREQELLRWPPKPPPRCPTCGYDLRATPDRCPECGMVSAVAQEAK